MLVSKPKGIGAAGCCCGGCATKPMDERSGQAESHRILQNTCCRCIPNTICITVAETGYDTQSIVVHRLCGTTVYTGHAIQYTASVKVSGTFRTLHVRMFVIYGECYIGWDIPALSIEDSDLVDRTVPSTICNLNMEPKKCSEFGGSWVSGALTITIAEAPSKNVKDLIKCGGCSCICDCMCLSIWNRAGNSIWTIAQSNATVCSVLTEYYRSGCGVTELYKIGNALSWSIDGWVMSLGGNDEFPVYQATIDVGTESLSGSCDLVAATLKTDSFLHIIDGDLSQVTYDIDVKYNIALGYKWVGTSKNESSVLTIAAYDWVSSTWVTKDTLNGRADAETIELVSVKTLGPEFTGTGLDEGEVRIRLTTTGDRIETNLLFATVSECCALTLTPPESVVLTSPLPRYVITTECPTVTPSWSFVDYSGTEWNFAAECRWCGGNCGSKITTCCARPLPRFLFAEVVISCPGCVGVPFTVPLDAGPTGSIWSGCTKLCNSTGNGFCLSLTCSSGIWTAQVTLAPGACTLDGVTVNATSASCDPVSLVFSGVLKFGLGCCGVAGTPFDTPGISITVIE